MKTLILLALVFLKGCTLCPARDLRLTNADLRFEALSQIESGDNDFAIGKDGERGRYQESQSVFREYNPKNCWPNFKYLTNADLAWGSACGVMLIRDSDFKEKYRREPTDAEWYLLWHRPSRPLHPKPIEAARAQRFANLVKQLTANGAK